MIELYNDQPITGSNLIICPSILSADFANLGNEISRVALNANWIHIDVMDGQFVPNISFGIPVLKAIRPYTTLPLDVHLMIEDPVRYIDAFAQAGADLIVVHTEACKHLHRVVETIRSAGKNAGVALNPGTPLTTLYEILPYVDLVLLMTVNPGFGGQQYIPTMTKKITELKDIVRQNNYHIHIQVDGGIGPSNIKKVVGAGANAVVVGNSVYGAKDPIKAIMELRACVE
jgi:ribulose-phosphate 3-epimerase